MTLMSEQLGACANGFLTDPQGQNTEKSQGFDQVAGIRVLTRKVEKLSWD